MISQELRPASRPPQLPAPGFADPGPDSQRCFRRILKALSYPGRLQDMGDLLQQAPEPLFRSTAAVCLTLIDLDTPVWLSHAIDTPDVRQFLSFHCGCPVSAAPGEAAFALLAAAEAESLLARFHPGTPEYPDRAATLLIQAESLSAAPALPLTGPGILSADLGVSGAGAGFWAERTRINAAFPTGLDMLFLDPRRLAGLPRSTRTGHATEASCTSR